MSQRFRDPNETTIPAKDLMYGDELVGLCEGLKTFVVKNDGIRLRDGQTQFSVFHTYGIADFGRDDVVLVRRLLTV